MIFVTIGTQEPFDRLIKLMDNISQKLNLDITAQVSLSSTYKSRHLKCVNFLNPTEFDKILLESELIVAHAGMGTIISSLVNKKPLIVFPREKKLMEHRSDHQIATANYFEDVGYINVARDEFQLETLIQNFICNEWNKSEIEIGDYASETLIDSLKMDILDGFAK